MNEGKGDCIFHPFDGDCRRISREALADDDFDTAQVVRRVETVFWSQEFRAEPGKSERLKIPFLRELLYSWSDQSQIACISFWGGEGEAGYYQSCD